MLGKNLKDIRLLRGYPQVCVAKELFISPSTLSKYESGDLEPNIQILVNLALFYKVSLDRLLKIKEKSRKLPIRSHKNFDDIKIKLDYLSK